MPLSTYTPTRTSLWITDRVQQGTVIAQEVSWDEVRIQQLPDGGSRLSVTTVVTPYSKPLADEKPERMPADFKVREVPLVGDDATGVDDVTGALLYLLANDGTIVDLRDGTRHQLPKGQLWRDWLHARPEQIITQGWHFSRMRDEEEINFGAEIMKHVLAAVRMGKYD